MHLISNNTEDVSIRIAMVTRMLRAKAKLDQKKDGLGYTDLYLLQQICESYGSPQLFKEG